MKEKQKKVGASGASTIIESAMDNETGTTVSDVTGVILEFAKRIEDTEIYQKLESEAGQKAAYNYTVSILVSIIGTIDQTFKKQEKETEYVA